MSSRVLRARLLRDRVSVPGAASPVFLTSLGRCEACPSVPPDSRSAPVAVTRAPNTVAREAVYTGHFVGVALLGGLTPIRQEFYAASAAKTQPTCLSNLRML